MQDIVDRINALEGVLTLEPRPGDGSPEIAWGDLFFYYAPDGVLPKGQPFATVVTKDYPDDTSSRLDRPGAFRVNIAAGKAEFHRVEEDGDDRVVVHPVYGGMGWLAVVNPGPRSAQALEELLVHAHHRARERFHRKPRSTG